MVSIAALLSLGPTWVQAVQQRRRKIGDRTAHRLRELLARRRVLLLLDRPHAEHEARDAVVLVDLQQPLRQPHGLVDLAVLEHRREGAARAVRDCADRRATPRGSRSLPRRRRGRRPRAARPDSCPTPRRAETRAQPSAAGWSAALCGRDARPYQQGRKRRQGRPQDRNRRNHGSVNSIWRSALGAAAYIQARMTFLRPPRKNGHVSALRTRAGSH